jgi:hypothetical protein
MKRFLKYSGISLLVILGLLFGLSYWAYNSYWAEDKVALVNPDYLDYFHEDYEICRRQFVQKAEGLKQQFDSVQLGQFLVESRVDDDLTIDWCYIPPLKDSSKLLILTSGLHGIEGYTGSAVQLMFMDQILKEQDVSDMGVILLHGINPYGFKYMRKVTENNVDLNRNCIENESMDAIRNDGYGKLKEMLMPEGKVNVGSSFNRFFYLVAMNEIAQKSMPVLRQAALQGQYQYDKGMYYGGVELEPQMKLLKPFLKQIMEPYEVIMNVDLHTAYGERGKLHLFLNPIEDSAVRNGIETVFEGESIDWGSGKDFYTINGEYVGWVGSLVQDALYLPMLFEYGTLDSQKTFGSIKSIHVMINENQGAHYGFKNERSKQKTKHDFKEMYYPSSPAWRSKVMTDSHELMTRVMKNYQQFKPDSLAVD